MHSMANMVLVNLLALGKTTSRLHFFTGTADDQRAMKAD